MPYLKLYWGIVGEDADRKPISIGNLTTPVSLPSIVGTKYDATFSVATVTTKEIWNADNNLGDFDFLLIVSDTTGVYLEATVDKDGTPAYLTKGLYANSPVWFVKDDAYEGDYTANFGAGTIGTIDRIRVRNTASTTASVRIFAIT